MKNFINHYGISQDIFASETIAKNHGNDVVDIVYQNPDLYGFIQDKKTYIILKNLIFEEPINIKKA